ncbi:hypothetical protein DEI81_02465 [Curtobacterium sp. MCBD17_013]|uniref:hypothetical protein n=1 Tax=Curtobacterium sp. MCBD17_013 TaxID=2175668 RepID=UPI000DA8608C|nr:hypothetical protein [Curtobacterium sp. MCBD17_013]PZF66479.1 hypothetical protein DEI81_02465 [Curtobacterium sp. MCBD17_013]
MQYRLRQSSGGIRIVTICVQLIFAVCALGGLLSTSPSEQSELDRSLDPVVAWGFIPGMVLLTLRTLLIGVYLRPDEVVVRSWLRTYRIPLVADTQFSTKQWSDIVLTRGWESRVVHMLHVNGPFRRSFPATAVRRSRALAQAELLNAYLPAQNRTAETARDYARGEAWRRERAKSRARAAERRSKPGRHVTR